LKNIEHLGIVGDVVRVRSGYARNYLLPHGFAEVPTPSRIASLEEDRSKALSELAHLRSAREELLERMDDITLTMTRSCNDHGVLYGSVTQRDICDALQTNNLDVGTRSVRLSSAIRRIGTYPVPIQFDKDLRTEIMLVIEPDQPLEEREEMEFDNEGNLIIKEPTKPRSREDAAETVPTESAEPVETSSTAEE
jgi:large subunit ribosomal protein L9